MKSAYELAMERLDAELGPTKKLTDEAKAKIAEIDKKYDAEIAAIRIDFDGKLVTVATPEAYTTIRDELAHEVGRAEERRENEKNAIWKDA